jgi:Zn-dependent protease
MSWWVHELYQDGRVVQLVAQIFWVILSITLHELAHGWAAIWQGDDTPRRLHRMTANPMVHMGGMSLIVFLLIGIAWGVMPVDPSRFRWRRRGRVFVAAAGPAMNLVLAFSCLSLLVAWLAVGPTETAAYRGVAVFLFTGGSLNIVLAFLNLLPVPPLDGSTILGGLSWRAYQLYQNPQAVMFGMFILLVIFFATPLGDFLWFGAFRAALTYVDLAGILLGNPSLASVIA